MLTLCTSPPSMMFSTYTFGPSGLLIPPTTLIPRLVVFTIVMCSMSELDADNGRLSLLGVGGREVSALCVGSDFLDTTCSVARPICVKSGGDVEGSGGGVALDREADGLSRAVCAGSSGSGNTVGIRDKCCDSVRLLLDSVGLLKFGALTRRCCSEWIRISSKK